MSESALYDIARTRPIMEIFPSLKSLTCDLSSLDPTFMSESVVELYLTLNVDPTDQWQVNMMTLFQTIHFRMPNIERIHIMEDGRRPTFSNQLEVLIKGLPNLTTYERPAELLSPLTMRPFLSLVNLERIAVTRSHSNVTQDQVNAEKERLAGSFDIPRGSFLSLKYLDVNALTIFPVTSLLNDVNFPSQRLVDLWINLLVTEETSAMYLQELLRTISSSCTGLESLIIRFSLLPGQTKDDALEDHQPLKLSHIQDFLEIERLKVFSIEHILGLSLTLDDITYIANRARRFRTLWLNPKPYHLMNPGLSLEAVVIFADKCPQLKRLGLFLDASLPLVNEYPIVRFGGMEEFFVGNSPLPPSSDQTRYHEQCMRCARLLSSVLSPRCIISFAGGTGHGMDDIFRHRALTALPQDSCPVGEGWRIIVATITLFALENIDVRVKLDGLEAELNEVSGAPYVKSD